MRVVLSALVLLVGLADLIIVASFLVSSHDGAELARAAQGLSIIRAHCTSFFSVAALSMIAASIWKNGDLLLVPTFIFIGALIERAVNYVAFGPYPEWLLPMALDAAHIVLLLAARHAFRQSSEPATEVLGQAHHLA